MKKVLMFAAALTLGAASATPFVHPADRTVSKPSDVKMGGTLRLTVAGDFDTYNPQVAQGRPNIPELTKAGGLLTVVLAAWTNGVALAAPSVRAAANISTFFIRSP